MRFFVVLALCLAAVAAVPQHPQKIVGGAVTSINQYPSIVALLWSSNGISFWQACGGTILNTRSVLTAAHCTVGDGPNNWRMRVGSSYASSGGTTHNSQQIMNHPSYDSWTMDSDVSIIRTTTSMVYSNYIQAAFVAGTNYNLPDNQSVWAAGWGTTSQGGQQSEQLRHVEIWTVNQNTCAQRYATLGWPVTATMLCSGWLDVGGRDQCQGDSGGPLYHNGVVVGVCSWGYGCAHAYYPGVNARVSALATWIGANA